MSQTLNDILARRSVRSYTDQSVDEETLRNIVQAGESAAHGLMKSRRFTVIADAKILKRVNEVIRDAFRAMPIREEMPAVIKGLINKSANDDADYIYGAPTFIIASADENDLSGVVDVSLALGNMMIAAESLGLGSCWMNQLPKMNSVPHVRSFLSELQIPEGHAVHGTLVLGYAANRSKGLEPRENEVVFFL